MIGINPLFNSTIPSVSLAPYIVPVFPSYFFYVLMLSTFLSPYLSNSEVDFHHMTVNCPHTIDRPLPRRDEILGCGSYTPKLPTGGQNITVLTRGERGGILLPSSTNF
jgi:hypothetical protein